MNVFSAMEIAASGLTAQRTRMNIVASNLANAQTTRTAQGGPYQRLDAVFEAVPLSDAMADSTANSGRTNRSAYLVNVPQIVADQSPPNLVYDPAHPDANPDGFVAMPNVNVVEEMVNMMTASRAYEAGVTVMNSIKGMARSALSIGA